MAYRLLSSIAGFSAARRGGLDIRLSIAGLIDPKTEGACRALADSLGVAGSVEFKGPYTGADAPEIYRSADAYLMTKHNDPCPNAVIEAMAAGLPVLYSASGGVPEQVGQEAGVALAVPETFDKDVFPEPDEIAKGMSLIIKNHAPMAAAARARAVEQFDLSRWFARHEAVFHSLLEKQR